MYVNLFFGPLNLFSSEQKQGVSLQNIDRSIYLKMQKKCP